MLGDVTGLEDKDTHRVLIQRQQGLPSTCTARYENTLPFSSR